MSGKVEDITENDLLAYVDGQLNEADRERVERHLASDPAAAALVEDWRRQDGRLQALYGSVISEPVPDRLRPEVLARPRRSPDLRSWQRFAAAVALVVFGAGSGWFGHDLLPGGRGAAEPLVAQAVEAHDLYSSEVLHPVEVKAEESAHLRTWLSKRLDRKLSIPDLRAFGLTLVGGRLLPASGGRPAAQIMYESDGGQRLTLYVIPADDQGETAFRYARVEGLDAISWTDEDLRCALIGGLPREELQAIAKAAYGQLT